jgi:pseudouridine kinase
MTPNVTVIGGINLDLKGVPHGKLLPATSNPGHLNISAGGWGEISLIIWHY